MNYSLSYQILYMRKSQIIVNSMHRYQPNIHIVVHSDEAGMKCRTFTFSNTSFMAVTAYQNHRVIFILVKIINIL